MRGQRLTFLWAADGVAVVATILFAASTYAKPVVVTYDTPVARQVMEIAEKQVRDTRTTPPEAARLYAYTASAYTAAFTPSADYAGAVTSAQTVMTALYPTRRAQYIASFDQLRASNGLLKVAAPSPTTQALVERLKTDGFDLKWDGNIPTGPGKWVQEKTAPFSPRAGDWQRWTPGGTFTVPPPPEAGSAVDREELAKVYLATTTRDGEWTAKINFWAGAPGSDTPAGIWQNQLFSVMKADLPSSGTARELAYTKMQSSLAQGLADAFMECWKVKYTYWTARPSMRESISKGMDNPPFPGYVAGHAASSQAAADILSVTAPAHKADWQTMAATAGESRVIAGIHFNVDVQQGFALGHQVATNEIAVNKLTEVLKAKR